MICRTKEAQKGSPVSKRPETVEGRWDILYRDYPEVYEEFAQVEHKPTVFEVIERHFPLEDHPVLDVGSGTGKSTFAFACTATMVVGVEPEDSMRAIAVRKAQERGIENVRFLKGWAQDLPLDDDSVDVVTAITLASLHSEENVTAFVRESERVVRAAGLIVAANIAPQWYGGELAPVIYGKPRDELPSQNLRDVVLARLGFQCMDYFSVQDYGTVEKAVRTYGFIHGRNAIEHIREREKTTIKWKVRIHHRRVS